MLAIQLSLHQPGFRWLVWLLVPCVSHSGSFVFVNFVILLCFHSANCSFQSADSSLKLSLLAFFLIFLTSLFWGSHSSSHFLTTILPNSCKYHVYLFHHCGTQFAINSVWPELQLMNWGSAPYSLSVESIPSSILYTP